MADENFSTKTLQILRVFAEYHVCANKDVFACNFKHVAEVCGSGTNDEDWIPEAQRMNPKPTILSGDWRILTNPLRLSVLKRANLNFVCLVEGYVNLPFQQQVLKILKAWDSVCLSVASAKSPSVFRIAVKSREVTVRRLSEIRAQSSA